MTYVSDFLMAIQVNRNDDEVCERLKALGYAQHKRIKIYGEEFDLTPNPIADGNSFAIEAVSRKSGAVTTLHIPLSVLQMISKDVGTSRSRKTTADGHPQT